MPADRNQVVGPIREFVAQHSDKQLSEVPQFAEDRDLFEQGDLNSFGFVEMLSFLADRTARELDLSEVDPAELAVVGKLVDHFTGGG